MSETSDQTGGCRCGAVRFSASSAPQLVSYCHCSDCRHATGAPVAAFVGFRADDVTIEGRPTHFENGTVERCFCAACGSPLSYTDARIPGCIYFLLGAMDAPENYVPTLHAYVCEQLPYLHIDDGLTRFERTSVPRPTEQRP